MLDHHERTARVVQISDLRAYLVTALQRVQVPEDHAGLITDVLIDCELRGYDDHGVMLMGLLVPMLQSGTINPQPEVRVIHETASAVLLDGDRGMGVISAMQAMRWCIERAREQQGIACAGIRNCGYCIASAPYVALAAEAGLIGFTCANANPVMAPPGGRTPTLGTNPLAFAVPAGRYPPLICDMATSTSAAAKVRQALLEGRSVPEGWIADAEGRPTTNPADYLPTGQPLPVGLMLPLGTPAAGHKGFALVLLVDVLAGALTGGGVARGVKLQDADAGQFFWALDVSAFGPREDFLALVDMQIAQIKASERLDGVDEIVVAGERGQRRREMLIAQGTIPLSDVTWGALVQLGDTLTLPTPSVFGAS
jgi:LDH2 family malate/lactate/ureidoglycolate dehydrogenase